MIHQRSRQSVLYAVPAALGLLAIVFAHPLGAQGSGAANEFYDSHFHLTNYIQQGLTPREFLQIMGTRVGRSTLFGIPLQQLWSYRVSGDEATSRILCFNPMKLGDDGQILFCGLWYDDEFVRTAGGWRMTRRVETKCFDRIV